jgi:hypothetical protein
MTHTNESGGLPEEIDSDDLNRVAALYGRGPAERAIQRMRKIKD